MRLIRNYIEYRDLLHEGGIGNCAVFELIIWLRLIVGNSRGESFGLFMTKTSSTHLWGEYREVYPMILIMASLDMAKEMGIETEKKTEQDD